MIYNILVLGVFFTSFLDYTNLGNTCKYRVFILWNVIFWLFKGFAWDTGADFSQFYATFEYSKWTNIFSFWRYGVGTELMEPGYVFLNVLIKTFFPHYTFFLLIVNGFILYSFGYLILKYVPQYKITAFAIMIISTEMFPVRQTVATAILCFSYTAILERNIKKYTLFIIFASLIHKSTLLFFPLYWIGKFQYRIKYYIPIYIGLLFVRTKLQDLLTPLFESSLFSIFTGGLSNQYFIVDDDITDVGVSGIVAAICHLLLWEYIIRCNRRFKRFNEATLNLFCNLYFVLICLNVVGSLPGIDIIYRLSNNFWVIYPMLMVMSCDVLRNNVKKIGLFLGIIIISMGFFIKYSNNPIFDKEGVYYEACYSPYYSVFESDGENLIRSERWPNYN